MATKTIANVPDALILLLHRHVWQPARYAHPAWLQVIGFHPRSDWCYGERPGLDRCLNQALRAKRGTPPLPGRLTDHQQCLVRHAENMPGLALSLGLIQLGCGDYFLLPEYRKVIRHWLDDALIWQLFGLSDGCRKAVLRPAILTGTAISIGSAILYRAARSNPVLYSLLIRLPPPERALWPHMPYKAMNLLERVLCLYANYR